MDGMKLDVFCWISLIIFDSGESYKNHHSYMGTSGLFWRQNVEKQNYSVSLLRDVHSLYNSYSELLNTDPNGALKSFKNVTREEMGKRNSETCRKNVELILEGLIKGELWAIKMADARGRPESGFLMGELKWYGYYDECVRVKANVISDDYNQMIRGQFCTLYFPLNIEQNPIQGGTEIFVTSGVCVPDSCSEQDVASLINSLLKTAGNTSVFVETARCERTVLEFDVAAYIAIYILAMLFLLMVIGTGYDVIYIQWPQHQRKTTTMGDKRAIVYDEEKPLLENSANLELVKTGTMGRILQAFSVYTNGKKILDTNCVSEDLGAIHGIRFLSISWIVLVHTYVYALPFAGNIATLPEQIQQWTKQVLLNAMLPVDCFFTLSGFLLAYSALGKIKKMNWFMFYSHRFWRLTPTYMLVLMVFTALSRYFGNGPMWHTTDYEIDKCKNSWWYNLLYINNFQNPDEICMNWTWYLANEMQFYRISPLMLLPLSRFNTFSGLIPCFVFLLSDFVTSGILSTVYDLPPSVLGGGGDPRNTEDYVKWYYFKPFCRIGPYVIGIILGYILWKSKPKIRINIYLNLFIWVVASGVACTILYGLTGPLNGTPLSTEVSALYNATHRTIGSICVGWVIFACVTGNGGIVNSLLSWRVFIPLSRLSYCLYLVHPVVMFVFYRSLRKPIYLRDLSMIYLYLGHLVLSLICAFVTSLAFEFPMTALEKIMFKRKRKA